MAGFVKVASSNEIALGRCRVIDVNGKEVVIFNVGGVFYAINKTCPYCEGPLSEGNLIGKEVVCPWHGGSFDVTTGEVLSIPTHKSVARYNIRVIGTDIEIEI